MDIPLLRVGRVLLAGPRWTGKLERRWGPVGSCAADDTLQGFGLRPAGVFLPCLVDMHLCKFLRVNLYDDHEPWMECRYQGPKLLNPHKWKPQSPLHARGYFHDVP